MSSLKNKTNLNPEIIKQVRMLFELIEKEVRNIGEDKFATTLAEEYGDYLKTSTGFDMLQYAYNVAQTESEKAVLDLEEASYQMNDEAFYTLTKLYENTLEITESFSKMDKLDDSELHRLNIRIREAKEAAESTKKEMGTLWRFRAMNYRREIKKLQGVEA